MHTYTVSLGQQDPAQPQFSVNVYEVSVNESNIMEGFPRPENGFLVVQCTTDNITYSISDQENAGPFEIDSNTGSLFANADVDYEQATSYQFTVSCANENDTSLNDSAMVTITIEPVNEFRPEVDPSILTVHLSELTPIGTVLLSSTNRTGPIMIFNVSDRDQGPDNMITYTFSNGNNPSFESLFYLDPSTGTLTLGQTLDRDVPGSLPLVNTIRLTACDLNPPAVDCPNIAVTIFVFESNDNPPIFSQDTYTFTVPESFPINEVLTTVTCTDADQGVGAFSGFAISSVAPEGTPSRTFSIDNSGNITLREPLDYEYSQVYEINLLCRDNMGLRDNATVMIMVTDINDNSPSVTTFFDNVIRINDGSPIGASVLQFQCMDIDSIENANITYTIDTDEPFEINDITGNVTVSGSLTLPENIFTMDVIVLLECNDQGIPPLSDNLTVFLEIYKDDTAPPIIDSSSISDGSVSISEGAEIGDVLLQVVATDPTSPRLTYALRNESDRAAFVINSASGLITVNQSLDRETTDTYTFVVVVTEVRVAPGDPRSVEASVTVEILDINDNSPMFTNDTYPVSLTEDFVVGDTVDIVMCSDLDIEMNIEYEITDSLPEGTFPGTFAINRTGGEITLQMPLDYELSPVYTIDVVCSDSGGFQDNATVLITVTDVNDNTPMITTFFDDVIQVNDQSQVGFIIGQFQCTDADSNENGNITYSIELNDFFIINEITGAISVAVSLVLPDNVFYVNGNITVDCSDQGNPPLSNGSMIFYQIYKDDSTPPLINTTLASDGFVSIGESASIGTVLAQVSAVDTTSPGLTFSLVNESSPTGAFVIDSSTGVITVAQRLDRERFDVHTFMVVVTEIRVAPGTPQSDEIEFTVMIIDVNDNPPAFSQGVYRVTRPESFLINETIATVLCTDPDINENGTFSGYEISSVFPSDVPRDTFSIDDSTGNITLLKPLDYEFSTMYTINLLCFDNEGMQDSARVDIYLEDVNDNAPLVITFFPDPVPIKDSEMLGFVVRRFQCTDSDSRENGNVTYSFSDTSSELFSINPISGDIIVTSSLTLDSRTFLVNHRLTLLCRDQGDPPRSNSTLIFLELYKDDSTAPVINPASISNGEASISEGAQIGDTLLQVQATDTTSPGLQFELRSESSPGTFVIDSNSGLITVAKSLDRETVDMYTFQLVVTEVLIGPFTAPARLVRTNIEVMILDENDNQPQCNNGADLVKYVLVGNYSFNNSLKIADIMCMDLDEGQNAEITLMPVNLPQVSDGQFSLNTATVSDGGLSLNTSNGQVIFMGVLSKNATHSVTIRASDQGNPPLSTLINATLVVTGERREEQFTELERLLLIIVPSVSGGLLLCACLIIICLCCCQQCRKKKAKKYYSTMRYAYIATTGNNIHHTDRVRCKVSMHVLHAFQGVNVAAPI